MTTSPTAGPAALSAAGPRPTALQAPAGTGVAGLLAAVLEALTLPYGAHDYDRRLLDRATVARSVAQAALADGPAALEWNTGYLRARLVAEQAHADQHAAAVCGSCRQPFLPAGTPVKARTRSDGSPWCRWCVERCQAAGDGHHCRICFPQQDMRTHAGEDEAVRLSVERAFPVVAAFLAGGRGEHR